MLLLADVVGAAAARRRPGGSAASPAEFLGLRGRRVRQPELRVGALVLDLSLFHCLFRFLDGVLAFLEREVGGICQMGPCVVQNLQLWVWSE